MQQGHPALGGKPCKLLIARALPLPRSPAQRYPAAVSLSEQYRANPAKSGGLAAVDPAAASCHVHLLCP